MAVALTTKANHTDSNVTTTNFSHTIGGGDVNRLLIVAVSYRPTSTSTVISGITWGSQALTKVVETIGGASAKTALWRLIAPNTGTKTVTVTFQANVTACVVEAVSFQNVDQTTPIGDTENTVTNADTISVTVTGMATGDMALDTVGARFNEALTAGGSQTSQWQAGVSVPSPTNTNSLRGAGSTRTGTGSLAFSWTDGGSFGQPKALVAARIILFTAPPPPNPIKKVLNEVEHLVEGVLTFFTRVRQLNETEHITEVLIRKMAQVRIKNETEHITENVLHFKGIKQIAIADTEDVTESVLNIFGSVQQIDETETNTDSVLPVFFFRRIVNETERIPELAIEVAHYIRMLAEIEHVQEQVIAHQNKVRLLAAEQVSISEPPAYFNLSILHLLFASEFISITEHIKFSYVLKKLLSETIHIIEHTIVPLKLRKIINEVLQVRERLIHKLIKNLVRVLNDTVHALETLPAGSRRDRFDNVIPGPPVPNGVIFLNLIFAGLDLVAKFLTPVLTLIGVLGNPPALRAQRINENVHMSETVLKFIA